MKRAIARSARWALVWLRSLLRSTHGGAMLVSGGLTIGLLSSVGAVMSDYAWREAQWEELRAAVRAAVSAAGPLLGLAGGAGDAAIEERVGQFVESLLPRLDLDEVSVDFDASTRVTTVTVDGTYAFTRLWRAGPDSDEEISESVDVAFDTARYEVAVALDLSGSMLRDMPGETVGTRIVKLDALKGAMGQVTTVMRDASRTTPGSMMVAVVPFASAVNAADTGTAGPVAERGRTPGKERYVRMLAGADGTLEEALARARRADGQWVDTFHHYGVGANSGALRRQRLPTDLLEGRDWNLRRTNVSIDVSDAVPELGSWIVDDEDIWNGCLMARWGAYWDPDARPPGWSPDSIHPSLPTRRATLRWRGAGTTPWWPAAQAVAGWSPGGTALEATTPLHLSDAPPNSGDPHTLFTAYSWPDSRVGGGADHRLQTIMATLLEGGVGRLRINRWGTLLADYDLQGDNDWSVPGSRGGAAMCPEDPILPLTSDLAVFGNAVADLETVEVWTPCPGCSGMGATYLHLGIVWGLRALSPLWQNVWGLDDVQGEARPAVPCAAGEPVERCTPDLHKSILLVTDGSNQPGTPTRSTLGHPVAGSNPPWEDSLVCERGAERYLRAYHAAAVLDDETAFNARFSAYMDGNAFGGSGLEDVLDAFHGIGDRWATDTPARRTTRATVLESVSPWGLFRGMQADVVDQLMDEDNAFGFDRRPTQIGHLCRSSIPFGPYGRVNEHVYVGDDALPPGGPFPPMADVAPFNVLGMRDALTNVPGAGSVWNYRSALAGRLDHWFYDACAVAARRGVRVNVIFIGDARENRATVRKLESCVDRTGAGSRGEDDVFATLDAAALNRAFHEIFVMRRNLRFLN